jgi:hypothetical protein
MISALGNFAASARDEYPALMCWGNALWGYAAFHRYHQTRPAAERPGFLFTFAAVLTMWSMPGGIFTEKLCFGESPSVFGNTYVVCVHLISCAAVYCSRGFADYVASAAPFALLDSLGLIDNQTTAFNFMERAHVAHRGTSIVLLSGLTACLAGATARHFLAHGFVAGGASFDAELGWKVALCLAVNGAYFHVLDTCAQPGCVADTRAYELLAWGVVARNLWFAHLLPARLVRSSDARSPKASPRKKRQ